jgi:hypothetical protein
MDFSISIAIAAPAERVWTVMSDIEHWSEWTSSVTSIEHLSGGPLRVGSRARIRQPKFPPGVWRITELEPGRSFTWVTGSPLLRAVARHWVESDRDGSRAFLSLHLGGLLGPLFGWLTRDINNRYLELEANGLKRRSEGR